MRWGWGGKAQEVNPVLINQLKAEDWTPKEYEIPLGMASHDLSNTKTTILGATPGGIPQISGCRKRGVEFKGG